tara:strand:+ start:2222 stop:2392 length:171 start_codon:yes stop_codon:yes gene_type:complete
MKDKAIELVIEHNNLGQTIEIVRLLLEGKSQSTIASEIGVTSQWVYKLNRKYVRGV